MRTISAAEDALLTATGGRQTHHRVKVKDSGGTFRDLSTYPGQNLCLEATWKEDVDSPGMQADITLKREVENISLAPLKAASPLNLAFAYPGSYAKLIDIAREVQIEVAVVPDGIAPVSGDWKLAFHGYIDEIDPGAGAHLTLRCSDLQAKLRDTWIERERAYAFAQGANATKGCFYWRPTTTQAVGDRMLPTETNKNGHFYRATSITTGITGSTEPTWPTGAGATVTDGGVTWTESGATSETTGTAIETVMQQILDDNLGAGVVTLVVVGSPSFTLLPWKQDRKNVWDALSALVDLLGWDLRYKWDSGSSSFKLTLYTPNRSNTTADRTWTKSQRYPVTALKTQIQWIRNVCQVVYSDYADRDATGQPKRKTYVSSDSGSITAYGRRFCEVGENATLGINTSAQAQALADAMVSDLANPVAEHECDVPFFRFCELSDLYQWTADGLHYDSDQKLAVTGYTHRVTDTVARTTLQTRGKPSAGLRRWHGMIDSDQHAFDLDNGSQATISASNVVGGTQLTVYTGDQHKKSLPPHVEWHVSPTSSFTPSSATLVGQGAATQIALPNLIPGKTYYAKTFFYGHNRSRIVKSQQSAEFSFVAGQGSAGHLKEGIALGEYPLNGGFETRVDTGDMPDHWSYAFAGGGSFGTNLKVMEDGNGVSGNRYLRFDLPASVEIDAYTASIPIINDAGEANRFSQLYRLSCWIKNGSSNNAGAFNILIIPLDYTGSSGATIATLTVSATTKKGHWQRAELFFTVDSSTSIRSVNLDLEPSVISGGQTCVIDVDEVRIQCVGTPWYYVGDTTKFTDNYESIPGFQNSWVNFDTGTHTKAAFRRDQFGRIWLKGFIKSGTINAVAYTLPVGFRPSPSNWNSSGKKAETNAERIEIDTSGNVSVLAGDNTYVSLDGINFIAGY